MQFTRPWKTDTSLPYKATKAKGDLRVICGNTFLSKKVFFWLCLIFRPFRCEQGVDGGYWKDSDMVMEILSISFPLVWSEFAAVIHKSSRSAIDGLARREWHLTAVIPVHRRVIQADPLGLEHLSDRVEVLLLSRVRCAQVTQVSGLVKVPWGQPALVGVMAILPRVQISVGEGRGGGCDGVIWQRFVHGGARCQMTCSVPRVQAHGLHVTMVGGVGGSRVLVTGWVVDRRLTRRIV